MNKIKFLLSLLIALSTHQCKSEEKKTAITIDGKIKHFGYANVFLAEAHQWSKPIQTATLTNGHFRFELEEPPGNTERPFMASIGYYDSLGRIKLFEFTNRILSPLEVKYVYSSFLLDSAEIAIDGDLQKSPYFNIRAGRETRALYATQMMDFGFLSSEISKRSTELQNYAAVAKNYSTSKYLLYKLYENRALFKKKEFDLLLAQFRPQVLQAGIGKRVKEYAENKMDVPLFTPMLLENEKGLPEPITDSVSTIHMVILWASWCAPCRREIPEIKKLQHKYANTPLEVVSVSIDESKEKWTNALAAEQMPWKQLIVPQRLMKAFCERYEAGSIPDVLFIAEGKVIERFVGYSEDRIRDYENVITKALKR